MRDKERKRYTIRMSPCPVYDIAGMEQWLNDMAAKGLWLCRYTMGLAVFAKREPANLHYQLALLPYEPLMEKGLPAAQDEMIVFCEEYGWQYITKRGRFGIFMTEDEKVVYDAMEEGKMKNCDGRRNQHFEAISYGF